MSASMADQPTPSQDVDYRPLIDALQLRTAANRYAMRQRRQLQRAQAQIVRKLMPES
jgi:hypothetical protein